MKSGIVGADFLSDFDILTDLKRKILVDNTTKLTVRGNLASVNICAVRLSGSAEYPFEDLLKRFPHLVQPTLLEKV